MSTRHAAALIALLTVAGCTSNQYRAFEARDPFREGAGGTRQTVEGVDIWYDGTPPRRYQIIGVLTVSQREGWGSNALIENSIVRQTRRRDGDAAILIRSDSIASGGVVTPVAGMGVFIPVRDRASQFLIIKYAD